MNSSLVREPVTVLGGHHGGVRRVVILGRGGAGKSALSRQLSEATGIPAVELDALFWQPGPVPMDPGQWAEGQHDLVQRASWILDGDLGPYDEALDVRLRAADTVVVLDFAFLRCAWRTLRRGREQAEYWSWVWSYRRRSLPVIMRAVSACAPGARLYVLRDPAMARLFLAEARRQQGKDAAAGSG
jgi:adenylate kinase family enzyme